MTTTDAATAPHAIGELKVLATLPLGKTADWVAVAEDAVWVASTGPFAVHRIDPGTNLVTDTVSLPGNPCSGITLGFGSLWVPLCTTKPSLAKIELASRQLTLYPVGPAGPEGGIAVGGGSVWLIVNKQGALARIDAESGLLQGIVHIPAGSYNPHAVDGLIWISQADGTLLTRVDATSGAVLGPPIQVGPKPRFLTSGAGAVWTLNQGDGSVTRTDLVSHQTSQVALHTPGHGGDIGYIEGRIFTTMPKIPLSLIDANTHKLLCQWAGPGGDSLGLGFDSLWLTDFSGGTVSRIALEEISSKCTAGAAAR